MNIKHLIKNIHILYFCALLLLIFLLSCTCNIPNNSNIECATDRDPNLLFVYDDKLWLFGGGILFGGTTTKDYHNYLVDLWNIELSNVHSLEWNLVIPKGEIPELLDSRKSVWTGSDIYIVGGSRFNALSLNDFTNDLWKYSIKDNRWTNIIIPNSNSKPSPRTSSRIVYYDVESLLYFIGGDEAYKTTWNRTNDIWSYNIKERIWTKINYKGKDFIHDYIVDVCIYNDKIIIFSRSYDRKYLCVYYYDINNNEIKCSISKQMPVFRGGFAICQVKEYVIIYGGVGGAEIGTTKKDYFNDCWIFNIIKDEWKQVYVNVDHPVAPAKAVYHKNKMIMFGGHVCGSNIMERTYYNDIIKIDIKLD